MADTPKKVNPFAQFVEQPKTTTNPFEKFADPEAEINQDYGIGTKAVDLGKMVAAGLTSGTANIPLGIESAARNIPRQALEQQQTTSDKIGALTFAEELVKKGPSQLFANVGRSLLKSATGQSVEEQQKKQKEDEVVLDRTLSKIPHVPGFNELSEAGERGSKYITESISEQGKLALENSQVEGNILKSIQDRSVENLSFGKDPSIMGYALQGSQVLGSVVPVIATAILTKDTRFATTAPATVGFGQGAGEAVGTARQYIEKMSDQELAIASPYFKHMVDNGVDPKEARKVVTDKAGEYAAQLQGSVAAFGSNLTAKLVTGKFDKLLTSSTRNKLSQIALGTTAGMTEEGLQEFLEGVATDLGINKSVVREIGADSFANFIMGAVGGVVPGAYRGAVAKREVDPNAPVPPSVVPDSVAGAPAMISDAEVEGEEAPVVTAKPTDSTVVQPNVTGVTPTATPAASAPVAPPVSDEIASPELAELKREYDDLNAKLAAGQVPADQFSEVNDRLADLQAAMAEVKASPAAPKVTEESPTELTGAAKQLDSLIKNKDEVIKRLINEYQISPEYAAKAYDAQLEYTEAASRAYADHPNKISEKDFEAAINKHRTFFNKLKGVSSRTKENQAKSEEPVESPIQPAQLQEIIDKIKDVKKVNPNEISYLERARDAISEGRVEEGLEILRGMVGLDVKGGRWASESYKDVRGLLEPFTKEPTEAEKKAYADQQVKEREAARREQMEKTLPPTKEEKIAANKQRQAEKKATAKPTKGKKTTLPVETEAEKNARIKLMLAESKAREIAFPGDVDDAPKEILEDGSPEYKKLVNVYRQEEKKLKTAREAWGKSAITDADLIAANDRRKAAIKAVDDATKQLKPTAEAEPDLDYATKIIGFRSGEKAKVAVNKYGQAFLDKAEQDGDLRSYTIGKDKTYSTTDQGDDKFYNLAKTNDGKYTLKQIHDAYEDALQEIGHANILATYEFMERYPAEMLQSAVDSGFVDINDAGTIWPSYDLPDIERRLAAEDKIDVVEESKRHKAEDDVVQEQFRIEREAMQAKEKARAAKKKPAKQKAEVTEEVDEEVDEDESGTYQLEKDPKAEKIVSPDGNVQIFLREITEQDPKSYDGKSLAGKWVVTQIYKTPQGGSYGPGRTPKTSPLSYNSKQEAIKSIIGSIRSLAEKESKRINAPKDETTLKFLDKLAADNKVIAESKKEEPKVEAKEEKPAGKLVPALPLNQDWATGRDYEITPEKVGQEVYDYYEKLKAGDLKFTTVSYTGANALKRSNQTNKDNKANYDKAARLFLGRTITTKTPTKNQPKIDVPNTLFVTPLPIAKIIKGVAKSVEEQKAEMFDITALKDEPRIALKGVLVEPDKIVATDGHRMAILTTNTGVKEQAILDKDGKAIDSSYPNYKLVAGKVSDIDANIGVNAIALGDYVRGVTKASKYIQGDNTVSLSLDGKLYPFNAKYLEDMTNLFRKLGYDEFYIGLNESRMLVAKSPDGKLVQYVMGMKDGNGTFMPFEVRSGEPGTAKTEVIEGEGLIREITPREVKLIENATNKLSDSEVATLEQHYGIPNYSMDFAKRIREDAIKYINEGADAVDKAIRSIISKVAAALLSVAIVFNPNFMSDASAVVIPQQVVEVRAEVPKDASGMSDAGKKAYSTLYPALKQGLQKNNKYFTVVDKPTSQMYVFNPDGSMLLKSNVLLGSQFGDNYVGQTDFKENRMTPAGLFKPKAEKGSATYDGKTVYTFGNVKEGWNAVFMHSVYLKAGDAEARLKALDTGDRTRLSYGCVNGPEAVMNKLDNPSMDESHVFIVPDNQAAVDDYIANRVSNEDLTRETVTPATERVPTSPEPRQKEMFAREEEADKPPKSQAEINRERQQRKQAMLKAESPFYGSFTNNIDEKSIGKMREDIKKEKSDESRKVKNSLTKILRTLAKGEASIRTQRDATQMLDARTELNRDKKYARVRMDSAAWFANQAEKDAELHKAYPNDPKYGLEPEVAAVIRDVATKYPKLLEGLKLGIKKSGEDGTAGNFNPFIRLVTLFKDTSGTSDPKTFRHEVMHSVEQMMPDDVYQMVINSWAKALGKAIAKYTDGPHKSYFEAVLDYIENPTEQNKTKAENLMPSYDMYQYMNPSEFWAVNAEKLFAAKLGGRWENFKRAISKVFESLKSLFGFENRYGVHKAFDRLFKGPMERGENKRMLVDYIMRNNPDAKYEFLSNFEEYDNRRESEGRSEAIIKTSPSVLDRFLGAFKGARSTWKHVIANPAIPTSNMGGKLARALTYVRVKNVWYGKGLEVMEARLFGGKLRDGMNKAIASVAVTNALHAGHIGSEVILRGKLIFNEASQMFQAVRDKFSMANVMMAKHDLIERVGLQRANNMIQDYFEAKRSRSIIEEYLQREGELAALEAAYDAAVTDDEKSKLRKELVEAEKGLKAIDVARKKVNMDDDQIDFYSALEDANPELRTMMDNWTAVNQNMIDNMEMSNLISKKRADQLRSIKDYVPWYRIKDNMEEVHSPSGAVRGLTNVAQEKKFGDYETDLDIDDIVDNMLHNVMVLTRNSIRNHAANQVAMAYATRNENGKIVRFGEEGVGPNGEVRTNVVINGKRVIIEIKDPLVAQSVLGMESVAIPGLEIFGMIANNLRRGVTLWPQFQLKQLFMDAPTAALVSGVKNPHAVYADTFRSFLKALKSDDPIVDMLKSYGIGGYQSVHRAPEQMYKQKIGLLEQNKLDKTLDLLDRVSDSSDYAQRIAIYNRVMKETNGDQLQAIMQANNVIDFMKHGSGSIAQFLSRTVSFMNAYAQQIDVLAETLAGGGLKGRSRSAALAQLAKTGGLLAFYSMMYCWAVGDDEDYQKLDDQTKLRNFFISKKITGFKEDLLIPMSTSASFFFKSIPELTYNTIITNGTKNEHDAARVRRALSKAALDSLLGPNPIATGVKPFIEVSLDYNFLTGNTVTPRGLKGMESAEQYNASTSELGKVISAASFGILNPIQADHLTRGLFGTTGSMVMYGSNLFNGERATPQARDNPMYGGLVAPDVARGPEDLFYDLKERAEKADKTFNKLHERGRHEEADKYFDKNKALIEGSGYTTDVGNALKEINKEIRRLGESAETGMNANERREAIKNLQLEKSRILEDISRYRRESGL